MPTALVKLNCFKDIFQRFWQQSDLWRMAVLTKIYISKHLQWLFLKFISCIHNVSVTFQRIFISSRSVHCQRSVHWVYSNLWVIWGLWWAIFNSWFCLESFLGQELQVAVVFAPLGNKRMPLAALEMNEVKNELC